MDMLRTTDQFDQPSTTAYDEDQALTDFASLDIKIMTTLSAPSSDDNHP